MQTLAIATALLLLTITTPVQSENATCPYAVGPGTLMVPRECYANSTADQTLTTTGCCWYATAGYLYNAIQYSNATGKAFLPPANASACAAAYRKALIDGGLVSPSFLSASTCDLSATSLAINGGACEYKTVAGIEDAVDLKNSSLTCTTAGNLSINSPSCTDCQGAVIGATLTLLNVTQSKEFVPCGMAATIGIWAPHSPTLQRFRSYAVCMLQVLQNVGGLGTDNLIPSPPPPPTPPTPLTPPPPSPPTSRSRTLKIAIGSAAACVASILVIIILALNLKRSRTTNSPPIDDFFTPSPSAIAASPLPTEGLYIFTKSELRAATNNYDERLLLGSGGAGKVYLGKLPSGHHVAIKRIYREKKIAEFYAEVAILAKLRHPNLATLVGYMAGDSEHALVYEYMAGGNLSRALYNDRIDWRRRLRVAVDVAEGLAYLHSFAGGAVVHRDVKPTNILLAEVGNGGVAKLSDFGVSRIVPADVNHLSTEVVGTMGYVDPDAFVVGHVSELTDVYSFGVVLLELVTGQRAVVPTPTGGAESIVSVARAVAVEEGGEVAFESLVDGSFGEEWDRVTVRAVFELACRCVRSDKNERPRMTESLAMLKGLLADLEARMGNVSDDVASTTTSANGETSTSIRSTPSVQSL